ncbi:hypothetical protein [Streptomyces gilvus]|uniref:hypothetical protein n=1 Tax=Streptomyces gilvus TaxID=2920937 RepID=UPI001F10C147|nr:hypothetical protein [Streptomyces sp. CME 23]MCH5670301.1 hypothetical protein [Streptomyces sp. CME 23]
MTTTHRLPLLTWSLEGRDTGCGGYCLIPTAPWPFVELLYVGDPDVRRADLPLPHGSYRTPAVPHPRSPRTAGAS